jgi:cysteinyl-tRNA synthetase
MNSKMTVSFKLFNTLSRSQEELTPLQPPAVSIYTCGPTVYGDPHIGNFRTYIFEDVLVRALRLAGYQPNRVMNVTDVGHLTDDGDQGEDKMEVGARREGLTAWQIAKKYEEKFLQDIQLLQLERPTTVVRATDTIQQQIAFIEELEAKGYTYRTSDGIYFDSSKVGDYGKLARLDIEGLSGGERVTLGEKRQKTDFALWKFSAQPGQRHMEWESPWGVGFPGWHIECSAIIKETLGEQIDIHCGGADHIPVHHTNEIAQSEALTGKPLAQVWLHSEFLLIDGGKMSKSLGNIYSLQDLEGRGFDPLAFKLFCFSASYRSKLNFTWEALQGAAQQLKRLRAHYQAVNQGVASERAEAYQQRFLAALSDDLNTPVALAVIWEAIGLLTPKEARALLEYADQVLNLELGRLEQVEVPADVQELLDERATAREAGDWVKSDQLRDRIAERGFKLSDTASGQQIERLSS